MGDEEYYFEDEYDDYGVDDGDNGDDGDDWEADLENAYVNAKSMANSNPAEAIKIYEDCIDKDEDKGTWTFKSLKRLVRTTRGMKDYDAMLKNLERTLAFKWSGRNRTDIEKFINKFLEQSGQVPQENMEQAYTIALKIMNTYRGWV